MTSQKLKNLRNALKSKNLYSPRRKLASKQWRTKQDTDITDLLDKKERFEYLNSKIWKQKKKEWWAEYFKKNSFSKCCCCNKKNIPLQLHHKTYKNYYGKERFCDLVQICYDCHIILHGYAKSAGFLHGHGRAKNLWNLSNEFIKEVNKIIKNTENLKYKTKKPWIRTRIIQVFNDPIIQKKLKNKKWIFN